MVNHNDGEDGNFIATKVIFDFDIERTDFLP